MFLLTLRHLRLLRKSSHVHASWWGQPHSVERTFTAVDREIAHLVFRRPVHWRRARYFLKAALRPVPTNSCTFQKAHFGYGIPVPTSRHTSFWAARLFQPLSRPPDRYSCFYKVRCHLSPTPREVYEASLSLDSYADESAGVVVPYSVCASFI